MAANSVERLDFPVSQEKKELIEQAAAVSGQSLTDFAIGTLTRRARKILREQQVLVLSDRDRDAFLSALDNPPPPNQKLRQAAKYYAQARKSGLLR